MKPLAIFTLFIAWVYLFKPDWIGLLSKQPVKQRKHLKSQLLEMRRERVNRLVQYMIEEKNYTKMVQGYRILRMIDHEMSTLRMHPKSNSFDKTALG